MCHPLHRSPLAELVTVVHVRLQDASVTVAFDEPFQHPEPELPGGGGLLDKAHFESAGEIAANLCGQVEDDLAGQPWPSAPAT